MNEVICYDCGRRTTDWVLESRSIGGDHWGTDYADKRVCNNRRLCKAKQKCNFAEAHAKSYDQRIERARRELSEVLIAAENHRAELEEARRELAEIENHAGVAE